MDYRSILFVAPNYRVRKGGIASVLKQYEIYLGSDFKFLSSIYFQNVYLGVLFFPVNIIAFLFKLIIDRKIDIVHIHGSSHGSFYRKFLFFVVGKFIFRKAIVFHVHASHFNLFYDDCSSFLKRRVRFFINSCDQLIVLSEEWEAYFSETFTPKNINVLENIVAKPLPFNKSIDEGPLKILFLGRIGERKGIFDLINCLIKYKETFKNSIELIIGGDGNTRLLEDKIKEFNLGFVNYLGWIGAKQKEELLKTSDILILPSYNEGLPISILEAMSFKMPIIATPVGGIPRVVKDGINGTLITPGNIEQLKDALQNYIIDKESIKVQGIASEKMVHQYYPASVFANLEKIYNSLDPD